MLAEIIAVGSEMLTPFRQDTNSLYLTAGLNELGVSVAFKSIIGDNRAHLTGAIRTALNRADIVVFSGGLGPTEDDLTRPCVAEALDIGLHKDNDTMAALYKRFAERRMAMPPNNEKQAEVLDGATLLPNGNGSAPGQWLVTRWHGQPRYLILLPGPPKELKPLFDEQCKPRLAAALPPRHLAQRTLRMALIPESQVDARTAPIYKSFPDVETTILAGGGEIQLHFFCAKPSQAEAEARVDAVAEAVEREMGDDIFSRQGESLPETVLLQLGLRGDTLAVAESCTGGLLAERLTDVPNASRSFIGGLVTYSSASKTALAGVPTAVLEQHGAVSDATARHLAEGTRARLGSTVALAITGIAGPGTYPSGPDSDKPVGLLFLALATETGTEVKQLHLQGDRERIRLWATQHALEMLRRSML